MDSHHLKNGLIELESKGINLFSCIRVGELPLEIKQNLEIQKIPMSDQDTLCLLGHGGKDLWKKLPHPLRKEENPIDHYAVEQMKLFAKNYLLNEIQILFPHTHYLLPLQKISRLLNLSRATPMGIDIHQEFGVWFGLRGLFLTKEQIPLPSKLPFMSPCENCQDRPCILPCPTQARLACPYQSIHQYDNDQQEYHNSISADYLLHTPKIMFEAKTTKAV
jgi:epoxyqueuosine reductase